MTRNVDKKRGLVNGAFAILQKIGRHCIVLHLDCGTTAALPKQPVDDAVPHHLAYPVALAYCVTITKMQGRTLQAVIIDPDLVVPDLAYTAVTRVRNETCLWWTCKPRRKWFFCDWNLHKWNKKRHQ